jgi:uncharacterized protein DUF6544
MVARLDEPVRRYFAHAIRVGAPLPARLRLSMAGHIKLGLWVPFTARQETAGDRFTWTATVGRALTVTDRYADGRGSMEGRLAGRVRLFRVADEDTTRSAAGRAALEAVTLAPACVLPQAGVDWRAEDADHIVAAWELPPERPEVHVRLAPDGAVRGVVARRWRKGGYADCGATVHAERAFGDFTIPSRFTVAWDGAPFFRARIRAIVT